MANNLEQYRQAKQDILKLHGAAKKELITRFHELANELLVIQKELREEFGLKLAIPAKPKATRPKKTIPPSTSKEPPPSTAHSSGITALERKLTAQKRKLEDAVKAGKPEKTIRDRMYEIEDELRLAKDAR